MNPKQILIMIVNLIIVYIIMMQVYTFWWLRIIIFILMIYGLNALEKYIMYSYKMHPMNKTRTVFNRPNLWEDEP